MALTIGFVWLAARAGRRAARVWPEAPLARPYRRRGGRRRRPGGDRGRLAAGLASLSFPGARLTVGADAASAAVWAGVLAGVGAGAGAAIEAARGRTSADVLRGGVAAYLWALGLLVIGVLVVATLEPQATRVYVDGLRGFGPAGAALFGAHLARAPGPERVAARAGVRLVRGPGRWPAPPPPDLPVDARGDPIARRGDPPPPVRLARALADALGPGRGSAVGGVPAADIGRVHLRSRGPRSCEGPGRASSSRRSRRSGRRSPHPGSWCPPSRGGSRSRSACGRGGPPDCSACGA